MVINLPQPNTQINGQKFIFDRGITINIPEPVVENKEGETTTWSWLGGEIDDKVVFIVSTSKLSVSL